MCQPLDETYYIRNLKTPISQHPVIQYIDALSVNEISFDIQLISMLKLSPFIKRKIIRIDPKG